MFRTLQGTKGTITLYHDINNKMSRYLLDSLKQHQVTSKDVEFKYNLDINTNSTSITKDQFKFLQNCLHTHPFCKVSFKSAFPSITENVDLVKDLENLNLPNNIGEIPIKRPLVVDWDHQLMAITDKGLQKIIDQYNGKDN